MVILQQALGRILGLNPVGARVWDLIDGQRSGADLAALIAAEFQHAEEQVAADVVRFLQELAAAGLIEVSAR
jgi:hypothetical protein